MRVFAVVIVCDLELELFNKFITSYTLYHYFCRFSFKCLARMKGWVFTRYSHLRPMTRTLLGQALPCHTHHRRLGRRWLSVAFGVWTDLTWRSLIYCTVGSEVLRRNGSEFWVNRAVQNVTYRSQVGWANFNSLDLVAICFNCYQYYWRDI